MGQKSNKNKLHKETQNIAICQARKQTKKKAALNPQEVKFKLFQSVIIVKGQPGNEKLF